MAEQKEKSAEERLIDDILRVGAFRNATLRRQLLMYLFEHADRCVSSEEIAKKVFGLTDKYKGTDERVRERTADLRDALKEYALTTKGSLVCSLPLGVSGKGYQLKIEAQERDAPTVAFWSAHLGKDAPILVYTEPIFFYDIVTGGYIRFLDVNPRSSDREQAIAALDSKHGAELRKQYGSSLEERLRPTRIYVGLGEVAALEMLSAWFTHRAFIHPEKEASDRIVTTTGSPILLGGSRTNKLIESYLGCEEGRHFGYRMHATKYKFISIHQATEAEKKSLRRFSVADEGEYTHAGNMATLSQVRDRLVIVHRMPVPGSRRMVTMISSEATLGIKQVAAALTNDEQAVPVIKALADEQGTLPESFELLFSVRIAPANMEHEAGMAELLACRKYHGASLGAAQ